MKPKSLGYIETESGKLTIKRESTGRDFVRCLAAELTGGSFIATMVASLCELNGSPITSEQAEDLEAGVVVAVVQTANPEYTTILIDGNEGKYPREYQVGGETFFLSDRRKIRHESKASKLSKRDNSDYSIWMISFLVEDSEHKKLKYDDILEMPGGLVQGLIKMVEPKKLTFIKIKK